MNERSPHLALFLLPLAYVSVKLWLPDYRELPMVILLGGIIVALLLIENLLVRCKPKEEEDEPEK